MLPFVFIVNLLIIAAELWLLLIFLRNAFDVFEGDPIAPVMVPLIGTVIFAMVQGILFESYWRSALALGLWLVPMCALAMPIVGAILIGGTLAVLFGVSRLGLQVARLGQKVRELRTEWAFHREENDR